MDHSPQGIDPGTRSPQPHTITPQGLVPPPYGTFEPTTLVPSNSSCSPPPRATRHCGSGDYAAYHSASRVAHPVSFLTMHLRPLPRPAAAGTYSFARAVAGIPPPRALPFPHLHHSFVLCSVASGSRDPAVKPTCRWGANPKGLALHCHSVNPVHSTIFDSRLTLTQRHFWRQMGAHYLWGHENLPRAC